MRYIKPLSQLTRSDLPLAGGKGANLGGLIQAQVPVPGGFVVTTEAYRSFVVENGVWPKIQTALESSRLDNPEELESASEKIRALFSDAIVSRGVIDELSEAYCSLGEFEHVAVRSSATAEDLPDLSFAGQQDTYLNIVGQAALLDALVRCWASLWTARAIAYRARNGIAQEEVTLAVVVQKMVQSEASGVMFTANPMSENRDQIVIDATIGLGEALVSGLVEPDNYTVDGDRIAAKTLGAKALVIHGKTDGGTATVKRDNASLQALPDAAILELARLGRRIERVFGEPQDIEWTWAGGKLSIVQSRPITTLYPALSGNDEGRFLALFSMGAMQGMLDPFTPLGIDTFKTLVGAIAPLFGLPGSIEGQRGLYEAGNRIFFNFTPLLRSKPGRGFLSLYTSAIDPGSNGIAARLMEDPRLALRKPGMKLRTAMGFLWVGKSIAFNVLRSNVAPAKARARIQRFVQEFVSDIEARNAGVGNLSERVALMEEVLRSLPPVFYRRLVPCIAAGQVPLQLLLRLFSKIPNGPETVMELTRGLPFNVTTEMDLTLWAVSRAIKADASSERYFNVGDAASLARDYMQKKLPPLSQEAIAGFMDRYGMRGVGEIDLGRPRWREEPTSLFQSIKSYLAMPDGDKAPDEVFKRGRQAAAEARIKLLGMARLLPGGRLRVPGVDGMIRRIRELAGLRETPKFSAVKALTAMREGLLASGRDLKAAGILENEGDIFFLRVAELKAVAAGEDRDWKALVTGRREFYGREKKRRRIPRVLLGDGTAFYDGMGASGSDGPGVLSGSPVSAGVVEGTVRVVFEPHATELLHGEILVCPGTDPAWTPLFLAAAGLVMEVGGVMTHGSVVAREYGIPAVVGVHEATSRLKTGQRVRVDGSSGRVTIL